MNIRPLSIALICKYDFFSLDLKPKTKKNFICANQLWKESWLDGQISI